jgi:hypothetical protein
MEGKIKEAIPTNVMGYDRIEEGLRMLQSGKGMGKMVFKPSPEDLVPIVPEQLSPYQVDADASYVLAGGLGGIGRSIAKWLVERGARNLVFLSRSGRITDSVERMKLELETAGCNVKIFTCDVSDNTRVEEVMEECKRDLPPIKGCIQASMVLKVRPHCIVFGDQRLIDVCLGRYVREYVLRYLRDGCEAQGSRLLESP